MKKKSNVVNKSDAIIHKINIFKEKFITKNDDYYFLGLNICLEDILYLMDDGHDLSIKTLDRMLIFLEDIKSVLCHDEERNGIDICDIALIEVLINELTDFFIENKLVKSGESLELDINDKKD